MNEVIVSPKEQVVYEELNPLEEMPMSYSVLGFIEIAKVRYTIHLIKTTDDTGRIVYYSEEEGEIPEERILGWVYYPEYKI